MKSKSEFEPMIDLHTHILPGLDDGARDLQEAVQMAEISWENGVQKVVATPHVFRGSIDLPDWRTAQEKKKQVDEALKSRGIGLEILLGAEVHLSHDLLDRIREYRPQLVLNKSSYLFVEFPSDHIFSGIKRVFFDLMTEGISPIITHPERNSVLQRNPEILFQYSKMGILCQANSGSFLGIYGSRVRDAVNYFLEMNMIHFLASDCHSTRTLSPNLFKAASHIRERYGDRIVNALVEDNPKAVLENRNIPYLPEAKNPRDRKKSLKIKVPSFLRSKKNP